MATPQPGSEVARGAHRGQGLGDIGAPDAARGGPGVAAGLLVPTNPGSASKEEQATLAAVWAKRGCILLASGAGGAVAARFRAGTYEFPRNMTPDGHLDPGDHLPGALPRGRLQARLGGSGSEGTVTRIIGGQRVRPWRRTLDRAPRPGDVPAARCLLRGERPLRRLLALTHVNGDTGRCGGCATRRTGPSSSTRRSCGLVTIHAEKRRRRADPTGVDWSTGSQEASGGAVVRPARTVSQGGALERQGSGLLQAIRAEYVTDDVDERGYLVYGPPGRAHSRREDAGAG